MTDEGPWDEMYIDTSFVLCLCSIKHYRPIALAPTLSKVFEWCISIEHKPVFATSSLQFGFKQGLSTDLCIGLINACYNVNDTEMFGYPLGCKQGI